MGATELLILKATDIEISLNGKPYKISKTISTRRWKQFLKLQVELSFGDTPEEIYETLSRIYTAGNQNKLGDVCVETRDLMAGILGIMQDREPVALKICCLFINRVGEDLRVMTDDMMAEKLNDIHEEGVDIISFFQFALSSIPGLLSICNSIIQGTSAMEKAIVRKAEENLAQQKKNPSSHGKNESAKPVSNEQKRT